MIAAACDAVRKEEAVGFFGTYLFDGREWTDFRPGETPSDIAEPWLALDIHDSDIATIHIAQPASRPGGRRSEADSSTSTGANGNPRSYDVSWPRTSVPTSMTSTTTSMRTLMTPTFSWSGRRAFS
jgi:hypothetical protein